MLSAIRSNDPKLKVDKPLFNDEDFDETKGRKESKKKLTLKDQIRKDALRKMAKESDSDDSNSDDDDDDSDADTKQKRHSKESKLFTKIGVPQKEEEEQIKKAFKVHAG